MSSINVGLEMGCLLVLGVLARKLKLVKDDFAGELSRIVLNFSLPCVIVNALMKPVSEEQLKSIPLILACVLVYLAAAVLVTKIFVKKNDGYQTVMTASIFFSNFTFMGYPVIGAFYGSEGVLCLSVISIPVRIVLYSTLPIMFSKSKQSGFSLSSLKSLLIPAVIAIPIGVIIGAAKIELPNWLMNVLTRVAATSSPLGMMVCGLIIADINPKNVLSDRHALVASFIRLILLPAITLIGIYFLPITPIARNTMVIFAALPSATIITAYAASHDSNPQKAAVIVTFSTLFSIATLPLWAWILGLI